MIKVEVTTANDKLTEMKISGHSLFAPKGEDLVCAGVSCVVIGGLNSLNCIDDYKVTCEEGLVDIVTDRKQTEHDEVVLKTILTQLKTIENSYPENIKITERKN